MDAIMTRWIDIDTWDACYDPELSLTDFEGEPCFGGLYVEPDDRCNLTLWFYKQRASFTFFWTSYYQKVSTGISGFNRLGAKVSDGLVDRFGIHDIAYERWNNSKVTRELINDGIEMVPFGMSYPCINAPSKELERLITSRELRHTGNPMLRQQASNLVMRMDSVGNIKPDVRYSRGEIFGIVTLLMAIGRSLDCEANLA